MAAPLALITQLFVDGAWTTYPAFADVGWEYQIGPDQTSSRPNRLAFQLNNNDLAMDPTNVTSALYEKIGLNTQARMRLNGVTLTTVEASSWQPDGTVEHIPTGSAGAPKGKAWCDVAGEGLLRRLGRWTDPIRSAMARQTNSYTSLTGYWPMEDPVGALQLSNNVAGGQAGTFTGTVNLFGDPGPAGSDNTVKIGSDGVLRTSFKTPAGNGYQLSWVAELATLPTSATSLPIATWQDTNRNTWTWEVNSTAFRWTLTAPDGTVITTFNSTFGPVNPTKWLRYRFKSTVSAGTVTYDMAWYAQDGAVITGTSNTYAAASTGRPLKWSAVGNAWTDGASYGHVFAVTDTALNLNGPDPVQSFNGYLGELSWQRFDRLMGENGLARYVLGAATPSVAMGRQKSGTLLDLLEEITRTEAGILYDEPADIALTFVTNRSLVNRTPALILSKSDVSAPLTKIVDDVNAVNDVTVSNADGSSATATLDAGKMSTLPPPAGVGRVKGTIDVNQASVSTLGDRANWELRNGTLDRPRYLQVTVSLLKNPALANTVTAIRPGAWIALDGVEPDRVMLRVISFSRHGGSHVDTVTFTCLPAELYVVGVYGAATSRYNSASTTLAAAITTTSQTSIALTTSVYKERWSTTTPYDVVIKGERMTVTAMTAGAGTGPVTQTATVTRAVNGVQKTHLAGAAVNLFAPVRYSLR